LRNLKYIFSILKAVAYFSLVLVFIWLLALLWYFIKYTLQNGAKTSSMTTSSIMTLSISDIQHNDTQHNNAMLLCWVSLRWVSHFITLMLNVAMLSAVMLSVVVPAKHILNPFCHLAAETVNWFIPIPKIEILFYLVLWISSKCQT